MRLRLLLFLALGAFKSEDDGARSMLANSFMLTLPQPSSSRQSSSSLNVLTPMGKFCPFISSSIRSMPEKPGRIQGRALIEIQEEMEDILEKAKIGKQPDPARLIKSAEAADTVAKEWREMADSMKNSDDFQIQEQFCMTEAHMSSTGMSSELLISVIEWEGEFLRAIAAGRGPPPLPKGFDPKAQDYISKMPDMGTAVKSSVSSTPFKDDAFDSPSVRSEYEQLLQDHKALIELGSTYGSFDPRGKIAFLDQIGMIQERWDIFFLRFKLMDALKPEFSQRCGDLLEEIGLNEESYWNYYDEAHKMMRKNAEEELNTFA